MEEECSRSCEDLWDCRNYCVQFSHGLSRQRTGTETQVTPTVCFARDGSLADLEQMWEDFDDSLGSFSLLSMYV
jgi:hypothetical protein